MRYISRFQWGATDPPGGKGFDRIRHHRVQGVVVHHSGVEGGPKGSGAVKAFERHHLAKGWDGIAYNWLVDETGTVFEGRGWEARGGATKGWNSKSMSICYTGWGYKQPHANVLESIQIYDDQGQVVSIAFRAIYFLIQLIVKGVMVDQTRHSVCSGL